MRSGEAFAERNRGQGRKGVAEQKQKDGRMPWKRQLPLLWPRRVIVKPESGQAGHIMSSSTGELYCSTEQEVRAWLRAGGYVYASEETQLYNDGLHGLYERKLAQR